MVNSKSPFRFFAVLRWPRFGLADHSPFAMHRSRRPAQGRGFTLIELLAVLLIFSLLALLSYRSLGAVLEARGHVRQESEKWRNVAAFFQRFERDVQLAAPRPVRSASGPVPAWRAWPGESVGPRLEFSRFASVEGVDFARRLAYGLNEKQEIELWVWPGLDAAPGTPPARHTVLKGVTQLDLHYLDVNRAWTDNWPASQPLASIPLAVRMRIVLASGETIVRLFALKS
jgi:general secretion pathway protein J